MLRISKATAILTVLLQSACVDVANERKPDDDAAGDFRIVESDESRLVVDAGGRRVAIDPPDGLCVDGDAAHEEGGNLVVLVGACAEGGEDEAVTTITLGHQALFVGGDRDVALDQLSKFLETEAGRRAVGMGGDKEAIRILDAQRTADTLFVLVEDTGALVADALNHRFWRAFTEINGRSAIASRGVVGASADADEASLLRLRGIMKAIKKATGETSDAPAPDKIG